MGEVTENILKMTKCQRFVYFLFLKFSRNKFFITDIERDFGYEKPQRDLRLIVKDLIDSKIIIPIEKDRYGNLVYKIDKKKLQKILEDGEVLDTIAEYVSETRYLYRV